MATQIKQKYDKEIVPSLTKQFGYKSPMAVPKVSKIVVNMGMGEAVSDAKVLDRAVEELGIITGQKPLVTKARKSSPMSA